jgi:hypothetical protein
MVVINFKKFPKFYIVHSKPKDSQRQIASRLRLAGYKSAEYLHKRQCIVMSEKDFLFFALTWS